MPPTVASDCGTASSSRSRASEKEIRYIHEKIKDEQCRKDTFLIVVVRKANIPGLEKKCRFWWPWGSCESARGSGLLTALLTQLASRIIPTTSSSLQRTIDEVCQRTRYKKLSLLVSCQVTEISFHVPCDIRKLTIMRCGKELDSGHLIIPGSSTFCGVRLDQWESMNTFPHHEVLFMRGVYVKLDLLGDPGSDASNSRISAQDQAQIRRQLSEMVGSSGAGKHWWDEWKGAISLILGLLAGTSKLVAGLKVGAGGVYFTHFVGVKVFAGYFSASAVASVAAPCALVALGTAAAVYFVPWPDLFAWLKRFVCGVWGMLMRAWDYVRSKLGFDEELPQYQPRPMEFS